MYLIKIYIEENDFTPCTLNMNLQYRYADPIIDTKFEMNLW